jgi:NiFe hydrogenase small subunit HydA
MTLNRRTFLGYCAASAALLGLTSSDLFRLRKALGSPGAPRVIWLMGSACAGCSISLLNRIADTSPTTAAAMLTDDLDLIYHPTLMAAAGESAAKVIASTLAADQEYLLVVEGGVPTAYQGAACWAWSLEGREVSFQEALVTLGPRASQVVAVGTCASYGGVSAAGPNPSGVQSVAAALGRTTLNVSGCPPHPDWIVWVLAQLWLGNLPLEVDANGRPTQIYGRVVHPDCPRNPDSPAFSGLMGKATAFGTGAERHCLELLGCRGPSTYAPCPSGLWNNRSNWCVDASAPCQGCTEPTFPGAEFFRTV